MDARLTEGSHPCDADLAAFAVGKLAALRATIVEIHLNQCDKCAAVVARSPHDEFIDRLHEASRTQPDAGRTPSLQELEPGGRRRQQDAMPWMMVRALLSPVILLPLLTVLISLVVLFAT